MTCARGTGGLGHQLILNLFGLGQVLLGHRNALLEILLQLSLNMLLEYLQLIQQCHVAHHLHAHKGHVKFVAFLAAKLFLGALQALLSDLTLDGDPVQTLAR